MHRYRCIDKHYTNTHTEEIHGQMYRCTMYAIRWPKKEATDRIYNQRMQKCIQYPEARVWNRTTRQDDTSSAAVKVKTRQTKKNKKIWNRTTRAATPRQQRDLGTLQGLTLANAEPITAEPTSAAQSTAVPTSAESTAIPAKTAGKKDEGSR